MGGDKEGMGRGGEGRKRKEEREYEGLSLGQTSLARSCYGLCFSAVSTCSFVVAVIPSVRSAGASRRCRESEIETTD